MNEAATFPMREFRTRRRIEFADTDMGGIVHFSRFFVFMETAEHEFLRALGAEVHMTFEGRDIGWPRVEASCQYLSPARLAEVLEIHVRVVRKGSKSMTYGFTFSADGRIIARGRMSSVCCLMHESTGLEAIPIPDFIANRFATAPDSSTD